MILIKTNVWMSRCYFLPSVDTNSMMNVRHKLACILTLIDVISCHVWISSIIKPSMLSYAKNYMAKVLVNILLMVLVWTFVGCQYYWYYCHVLLGKCNCLFESTMTFPQRMVYMSMFSKGRNHCKESNLARPSSLILAIEMDLGILL